MCVQPAEAPLRGRTQAPFMFSVDHCFPIKGQGTVMTGTVLSGTVQIHDVRFSMLLVFV
jgi:selenocysteine-specific translation elongation factor